MPAGFLSAAAAALCRFINYFSITLSSQASALAFQTASVCRSFSWLRLRLLLPLRSTIQLMPRRLRSTFSALLRRDWRLHGYGTFLWICNTLSIFISSSATICFDLRFNLSAAAFCCRLFSLASALTRPVLRLFQYFFLSLRAITALSQVISGVPVQPACFSTLVLQQYNCSFILRFVHQDNFSLDSTDFLRGLYCLNYSTWINHGPDRSDETTAISIGGFCICKSGRPVSAP